MCASTSSATASLLACATGAYRECTSVCVCECVVVEIARRILTHSLRFNRCFPPGPNASCSIRRLARDAALQAANRLWRSRCSCSGACVCSCCVLILCVWALASFASFFLLALKRVSTFCCLLPTLHCRAASQATFFFGARPTGFATWIMQVRGEHTIIALHRFALTCSFHRSSPLHSCARRRVAPRRRITRGCFVTRASPRRRSRRELRVLNGVWDRVVFK
jgi:hypothetical protein